MSHTTQTTQQSAQLVCHIKDKTTPQQRLQQWQQTCQTQGLSGEFALAQKLGQEVATAEQIHMIAELFGR